MGNLSAIETQIKLFFYEKKGNEFENFIVSIYKILFPDLLAVKPQGQKGDSSDGINEMKIFVYDMLIYKLNPDLIGLIGHDNRLFDMVDERQIAKAFTYVNNNLKQYICSISDTKFEEAQKHCEIDLNKFVRRNLNEKDKLFGFDFEE